MTEKKSWGDFYAESGGVDYLLDHLTIHKDFIKEILERKPRTALEAGCGSAVMSIFLAMTGIQVTACDRDEAVLDHAGKTADRWKARLVFSKQDLMKLDFPPNAFDVSFSQGVLEHMSDEEMRQACKEMLRVSKIFIFSVPCHFYRHKDYGNERLMPIEKWSRILQGIGQSEFKYYYYVRTKRNLLIRRPLMLMGILTQ